MYLLLVTSSFFKLDLKLSLEPSNCEKKKTLLLYEECFKPCFELSWGKREELSKSYNELW